MKSRIKWFLICMLCMVFACGCANALTYEEAISQASSSSEAEDYLVIAAPEASRVVPDILSGLSAEWTYEGDELTLTIDAEKTDWNQVVSRNYFPGSGDVTFSPGFRSPSGESTPHRSFGYSIGGGNTEKYMIELLRRDYEQWGNNSSEICRNGIQLGRYDEDSGLFQPVESYRHGLLCAWGEDGELQFNYMAITVRYSSTAPRTVKIPKVPASDVYALYDMPEADREQIAVTIENGSIHIEADITSGISQSWGYIAVAVPEEAGSELWSCNLSGNNINGSNQILEPSDTGLDRRVLHLFQIGFDDQHVTDERDATIEWVDEKGAVRGYSRIYLSLSIGDPKPWPYYVSEWEPVPASRMELHKKAFPEGVDATYDGNGLLTLSIDHDRLPETANFGRAFFEVFVSPPGTDCGIRGSNQSSGNNIFGADRANWNKGEQLQRTRDEAQTYEADRSVLGGNIFRTYHQQGSDLTVYMTSEMPGIFAGRIVLISWWEDGADPSVDEPYLTEYIVVRQENCVRVLRSTPLEDESELPQAVTQPVIIIPQGSLQNPNESMEFTAMIYPQQGSKARYYKLELVDEDGNPVDLEKGQYKVFLPFPEGISEEEKQSLELIHMTDAHVEIENMSINGGTLHLTDAGVWFQAKSFSPFMLKWGSGETGGTEDGYPVCECENGHTIQYEIALDGEGLTQHCECNESTVEFIGPEKSVYAYGEYITLIISWHNENGWWQGEEPQVYYAPVAGDTYGEWSTDMPQESGNYAVKLAYGTLETSVHTFTIADKITECPSGHTLRYTLLDDGFTIAETCEGDNCHTASVAFAGTTKEAFDYEEEITLELNCEGEWLGVMPKAWYKAEGSDEWTSRMPWDSGVYSVRLSFEALNTDERTFTINERIPSLVCDEGHTLYYVVDGRPNNPTNGIRELCEGSCHMAYVEIYPPLDTPEGETLDYVCSWDGEWLGEYPEVMFAAFADNTYGEWSTEKPTAIGSYGMKLVLGEKETDVHLFAIVEGSGEPECGNGNALRYELVTRASGESNGIRQFCPDGCHDVNITFIAPYDITEGGELDYVCSHDGMWLGDEYPVLEFAMNVDGEYAVWSTELPTAAGDYAMRMRFSDLITDYQTFSIFPAEEDASELILPANLTKIEDEAFAGTDVVSVICPDGLVEIGSRAFADCENLAVIVIPASVDVLAQDAFEGCGSFLIVGETGSTAHQFAIDHELDFEEK